MLKRIMLLMMFLLLVVACGQETPTHLAATATNPPPPATKAPATVTVEPTDTDVPPTATATEKPVTPTPSATPTQVVYGPDNFPNNINPLTGLAVEDASLLNRRPLGVKINVYPRWTRPPWGISLADIVFDYYHNDGSTRHHAIYYGQDAELVGPIRSGRLFDDVLVRMFKSIFAYGSADVRINSRLLNAEYGNRLITEGSRALCPPAAATPMCRYEPNKSDYLLTGTKELSAYATSKGIENQRQNLNGMTFSPEAPEEGEAGEQAYIFYSIDVYNRWDYDDSTGKYLLFGDNLFLDKGQAEEYVPMMDRLTDEQMAADNLVVLVARHEYYVRPPSEIVDILLSGTGPAYAFRDGQMYEVTWNRPTLDAVLYLTFADGTHYSYKPGNTFYAVVGQTTTITEKEDGVWRFQFGFP